MTSLESFFVASKYIQWVLNRDDGSGMIDRIDKFMKE